MDRGAELSPCGTWRYRLWRAWGSGPRAVFLGLNPSTADADHDDHTLRRCMSMARAWGADGVEVVNLYAYRATHPRDLWAAADPVGPACDDWIARVATGPVIACWGAFPRAAARARAVLADLQGPVLCLGVTRQGWPRHPSRMPGTPAPGPWVDPASNRR